MTSVFLIWTAFTLSYGFAGGKVVPASVALSPLPMVDERVVCESDQDCVPATCCHPTQAINKKFAPKCGGMMCTMVCSGPIDCGAGKIVCDKNKCQVKKNESESNR